MYFAFTHTAFKVSKMVTSSVNEEIIGEEKFKGESIVIAVDNITIETKDLNILFK